MIRSSNPVLLDDPWSFGKVESVAGRWEVVIADVTVTEGASETDRKLTDES